MLEWIRELVVVIAVGYKEIIKVSSAIIKLDRIERLRLLKI